MRKFPVVLILCCLEIFTEAKKERIYRLASGEYGYANLLTYSKSRGELEIRTLEYLENSKNDISQDENTTASSKNYQFTEDELLLFKGNIWIRLLCSEDTQASIAVSVDGPKNWVLLYIVKSELTEKNSILLQLNLGEKVEICYKPVDETHSSVEIRDEAYLNQTNGKHWLAIVRPDHADYLIPQGNSVGCREFHKVKDVYVRLLFRNEESVMQKRCTFPRLTFGWKNSEVYKMVLVLLEFEVERSFFISPELTCLNPGTEMIFITQVQNTTVTSTNETVASASHDRGKQDKSQQESGKKMTTSLGIELASSLPIIPSTNGIDTDPGTLAWIATPKLTNHKSKRIFASGNFNLGVMTLDDVYLEGKQFDVNQTDLTKSMLGVTYVDLAVDLSKTNLSVDKLVSSKYNNKKNGLKWIRMIVKSINQDAAEHHITLELIKGYEVYVKFARENKPLLAFGMLSVVDQSWELWIQHIRTNGKVESMQKAYGNLIQGKEVCEIGLRDSDNYKKPTKKFYVFGKSAINFVSVKLDSIKSYWTVGENQRVLYIDNVSVDAIGQLVPLAELLPVSQMETF